MLKREVDTLGRGDLDILISNSCYVANGHTTLNTPVLV